MLDRTTLADHRNMSGGRWLQPNDENWDGRYGADLPAVCQRGDQLGLWVPTLDPSTDAITGGYFTPVPPAQQYGATAASWIARQARRVAQLAREAAAPDEAF